MKKNGSQNDYFNKANEKHVDAAQSYTEYKVRVAEANKDLPFS